MAEEQAGPRHAVIITGIKDAASKSKVARVIERVSRGVPLSKIEKRLDSLPWTLTRSASSSAAARIGKVLERSGALVQVVPEVPRIPSGPPRPETRTIEPPPEEFAPAVPEFAPTAQEVPEQEVPPVPEEDLSTRQPVPGPVPSHRYEQILETIVPAPRTATERTAAPAAPGTGAMGPEESVLEEAGLAMQPLGLAGILDRTFQLCRSYFWPFLGIVAVPWLATIVVIVIAVAMIGVYGFTRESLGEASTWGLVIIGALAIPSVLVALVGLFYLSQGALIHAVSCVYLGKTFRVRSAYGFVFERFGRYLLTSMLFVLVVFVLVAAAPIAGVGFYLLSRLLTSSGWWSAFTWPFLLLIPAYGIPKLLLFDKVVIIENVAYGGALSRSWRLLSGKAEGGWPRGYFLRLIILLHLFIFINIAISLLFGAPAALLAALFPESLHLVGEVISQLLKNTGSLIAGLFGSVCIVVFYYDIRIRKEGFDLQMLAGVDRATNTPPGP